MLPIWLEREVAELLEEVELQMWLANGSNPELDKICLDSGLVHRAFSNLVRNASKYGKCQVMVTLQFSKENVAIHVDDNGPGIVT